MSHFIDIIQRKRDGGALSKEDIKDFVKGISDGDADRAQLGALLMAIRLKDMTLEETIHLTDAMVHSGETFQWPEEWQGVMVDKHSTGGVGDKVSLPLVPALAACGLKVPMISGRGLGHTGGTLDKLEAIPGFTISQSSQEIRHILETVGGCIVGQTEKIVPADKIMYATRHITATIDCLPLLTSSIISKKIAENLSALVLDTKFGKGAFLTAKADAKQLAHNMVDVSNGLGIKTVAVLSSMDAPLGRHVGNALEIKETIQCLQGKGPTSLEEMVTLQGGILLHNTGSATSRKEGAKKIHDLLHNGKALAVFEKMCIAQGVNANAAKKLCLDPFSVMRKANHVTDFRTSAEGYIHEIDAMDIAKACGALGAGRSKAGAPINHSVGVEIQVEVGDMVEKGQTWVKVHHDDDDLDTKVADLLTRSLVIKPDVRPAFSRVDEIIE
ncbi:thymidine phosphorylase-like [Lineus longissimus]|uniref:thymidine phosphorylase-like n=1 Tax=Lineus longissimus TaxID=88925 RepID=UPI002B4D6F3F